MDASGESACRLSVIIPYYNGGATIAAAVESVLGQTVQPFEIVICDDGSPDDLCSALGDLRDQVRVVRKENGGIASAMNALTQHATGDFLVQLDQDDVFERGRLQALAATLAGNPALDLIATDAAVEFNGAVIARISELVPFEQATPRQAILRNCFVLWPAIRRSKLVEVGGYDESFPVMQDWECFIRLILAGAHVGYVAEPLYRWRLTPGSRSSLDRIANGEALVRMMRKVAAASLEPEEREIVARGLARQEERLATERVRHAIEEGAGNVRKLSLAFAMNREMRMRARSKAWVAAISPPLARRLMARRAARDPATEALLQRGFPTLN